MVDPLPSGSAAWRGGKDDKGEYFERIAGFIDQIDQKALLAYASKLRENRSCKLSRKFSVGACNLVRRIQFDDGIAWIARLRMPPLPNQYSKVIPSPSEAERERRRLLLDMESELATMEFVRQNTDIPIPKVYAYDLNDNPIGCPFFIMEYIFGNTAEEVSRSYPGDHEGIPAQFEDKFWRQYARIMIQLASIRLPKIGSIIRNSADTESFAVGPLVETNSGPYDSAAEFYADYPLVLSARLGEGELPASGQKELIKTFHSLVASFSPPPAMQARKGSVAGFSLLNYGLSPNNIIVDRDFNVLAVIGWDSVITVPDAALSRFPYFMGIDCAIPGFVDTHPTMIKRQQIGQRFAEVVEAVGQEQAGNDGVAAAEWRTFLPTKTSFISRESLACRSLEQIRMQQDWLNHSWIRGLRWLKEHDEAEIAQFYVA
ncbi:MAG: hypothetical protein LQ352_004357 [Teloschistes flavicans]|nr:MAG: hypothetical protein LQ352_004357 [Teloschistes flavicans]